MLITQDLNVSGLLNKYAIGLLECLIPKEDNALLNVLDYTLSSLVGTRDDSDYIIGINCVVSGIHRRLPLLDISRIETLAYLHTSNVGDLALFIDYSDSVGGASTHRVD